MAELGAQILSQFVIKGVITCLKEKRLSPTFFVHATYGGMPSSHSALMAGLSFYLLLEEDFSNVTNVALVASLLIITDSFRFQHDVQVAPQALGKRAYHIRKEPPSL